MAARRAKHEAVPIGDPAPFVQEINRSAAEEVDKVLSRAKRTADARLGETRKRAQAEVQQILDAAGARAGRERRRVMSDLSLETKKITLKARGELVEEVLEQVRARLERTRGTPEYRAMLKALTIDGVLALDRGEVCVSVSAADAAMANEAFYDEVARDCGRPVSISSAADLDEAAMGAVVRAADGSVLFDNTIGARMDRMADELQLIVSHEVFADEPKEP
jgi:vacuolar-type H+-ATPase subunit E/Vma4